MLQTLASLPDLVPMMSESTTDNPMTASDWHNLLTYASHRKEQFGNALRWPSQAAYDRWHREGETCIMAGAMFARAKRLAA